MTRLGEKLPFLVSLRRHFARCVLTPSPLIAESRYTMSKLTVSTAATAMQITLAFLLHNTATLPALSISSSQVHTHPPVLSMSSVRERCAVVKPSCAPPRSPSLSVCRVWCRCSDRSPEGNPIRGYVIKFWPLHESLLDHYLLLTGWETAPPLVPQSAAGAAVEQQEARREVATVF